MRNKLSIVPARGNALFASKLREHREILAHVAQTLPQAPPPPGLKSRLMARIRKPVLRAGWRTHEPGLDYVLNELRVWKDSPFPGVQYQLLHYDREAELATQLIRMAPGSVIPAHGHGTTEQCLVLEGTVYIGELPFSRCDFNVAHIGNFHGDMTTKTGCTFLLIKNPHDEVVEFNSYG